MAQLAVVVIMPPARGRPYPVDLLLRRHHYRASAPALAAAGAEVFGTGGAPLPGHLRPPGRTGG